jgi:hypothetical protein
MVARPRTECDHAVAQDLEHRIVKLFRTPACLVVHAAEDIGIDDGRYEMRLCQCQRQFELRLRGLKSASS